ncbi:MAG TPA: S1C family serine protease [Desertimonas sp.]|nr:S1C family serine protease [Desertimonas sp.]
MNALTELTDLVRTATSAAGPSVVSVGRHGRGSGFVVAAGRVVTNAHNLRDRTTSVRFADGRTAQATVTGSDLDGDLVVLDVDTGDAAPLPWSDQPPGEGDIVVVVTAGRQRLRATWGQITGLDHGFRGPRGRRIAGAIEHTAPSAAGASGAPVLDRDGKVVAVNTHRVEHGFYLARPADDDLRRHVSAMGEGHSYERARLGVALAPPHVAAKLRRAVGLAERDGLLVRGVDDDSAAARAGISEGDLLVRAGDHDLVSADDLFAALADISPGGELAITLVRGTEELSVTATWPSAD